ncbi:PTS sugar transporter subunit IIC [Lacrimispora sp.]|jgi:PTS system cellobiose-specific IIC component|uniref:PTS sugar transporter subunit IIC n=1 Tax=Lacrimispora sp. TaxID=2719234 RepID=UPI002897A3F1|nr:PTS transporter subunit EIIC [Lacrimispora sp.]
MNRLLDFLQKRIVPIANKFQQIPFIIVLRNSMLAIIPLMIVGAIGTFITNMPFPWLNNLLEPVKPFFNALTLTTSNISGLVVALVIGFNTARHFKLDPICGIIISLAAFFAATLTDEGAFNTEVFGANGIFTAILVGYLSVCIMHLCKKYNIEIKLPDSVPTNVSASFSTILSLAISLAIFLFIRNGLGIDINSVVTTIFSPMVNILNSLPGLMLLSLCMSLFFSIGINPIVFIGMLIPILTINGQLNAQVVANGKIPGELVTWGMETIMCLGGTGATIGLVLLLTQSKSQVFKKLGRMGLAPSLFNINEPIVYGVPVIFNPIIIIPFIITPLVNIASTWFLMSNNVIGRAFIDIPWTTPPIINGFLMSGGDWRTTIWTGILVLVSVAIYYPFFKIAEKQQLIIETTERKD